MIHSPGFLVTLLKARGSLRPGRRGAPSRRNSAPSPTDQRTSVAPGRGLPRKRRGDGHQEDEAREGKEREEGREAEGGREGPGRRQAFQGSSLQAKGYNRAADARPGGDGKSNARLKIIAGLLGVGFDVLKQRDLRRRNRRLVLVTAFALVLTGVVTALAIEARIARKAAGQRQKQAEDLVAFMLTDLNDRLREVQRLDILEAVDNQAMAYFSALPLHDVTDQTLALRSKALQKIGNVRQDEGQLAAALESYLAASELGAELLRRLPNDAEREAAYAETLNHLGNAQYFQGDRDRALESFSRAAELLARATAERPQDDWLEVLSSARTNAGRVLETRGEFEAARKLYGSVLATARLLARAASATACTAVNGGARISSAP